MNSGFKKKEKGKFLKDLNDKRKVDQIPRLCINDSVDSYCWTQLHLEETMGNSISCLAKSETLILLPSIYIALLGMQNLVMPSGNTVNPNPNQTLSFFLEFIKKECQFCLQIMYDHVQINS